MIKNVERVLIVEDHEDAIDALTAVVSDVFESPEIVVRKKVSTGMEALRDQKFDIALLDLGLPDGSGIELVDYINLNQAECLSVVTTIFDDEKHLFDALKSGACGYLLKGHSPDELKSYLIEAVSGRPALSPSVAQSILRFFRSESPPDQREAVLEQLTKREMDVLSLIAKGYSVKEVSELLEISNNTVAHHIKSLYSKLNVHNRAEATAVAVQLNIFDPK
jgi:DNA-binding NarL/FixJ family response regulator